ncbi:hypothetical protein A2415_01920 [candidate division WWE3 bacterium RIFOXYC1_FULL_39_7]|uniref:Uncharacterized protein n=2 Tax=Katanobacteria TaxID=422282 RepID=A0A1F4X8V9_UNCKA|nr:MAG: hypothetical protein A2415_01920 [candidate division WWE3 bacterium RIFOXYC1_FULL_39_7]OGC78140.1 MAG: hypothetical protein A2619_05320 [candidate division WWE3 bacterium RIFOXYD1_FULL_39_9]
MKSVRIIRVVKLSLFLLALIVLSGVVYFFYARYKNPETNSATKSVFNSFIGKKDEVVSAERVELSESDLANFAKFDEFLKQPLAETDKNEIVEWNWETDMFLADVRLVDKEKGIVYLRAQNATQHPINRRTLPMKIECSLNEVVIYSNKNMQRIDAGVDIFEYVDMLDMIYTYCANEECTSIDKLCVLIDKQYLKEERPAADSYPNVANQTNNE